MYKPAFRLPYIAAFLILTGLAKASLPVLAHAAVRHSPGLISILPDRFTLAYQIESRDVRSEAYKQWFRNYARKQGADDAFVATKKWDTLLCGNNGSILLLEIGKDNPVLAQFDGHNSAEFDFQTFKPGNPADLETDNQTSLSTTELSTLLKRPASVSVFSNGSPNALIPMQVPLPGESLSQDIPIIRLVGAAVPVGSMLSPDRIVLDGSSPVFNRGPIVGHHGFVFSASTGTCERTKDGAYNLTSLELHSRYGTFEHWNFLKYEVLNGMLLPSSMTLTDYGEMQDASGRHIQVPRTTYAFRLMSASASSPPVDMFHLSSLLKTGDTISDQDHHGATFSYIKGGGTFEEQERHQEFLNKKYSSQDKPSNNARYISGVLLLAVVISSLFWLSWRRTAGAGA